MKEPCPWKSSHGVVACLEGARHGGVEECLSCGGLACLGDVVECLGGLVGVVACLECVVECLWGVREYRDGGEGFHGEEEGHEDP